MYGSYALIKDGIVENTIVADETFIPQEGYIIVYIEGLNVSIGNIYDGISFATDPNLALKLLIPSQEEVEKAERQITLINDLTELGVIS